MRVANGIAIRLASPGVRSDSWMITGTPLSRAATTTGTDTKPPLENTRSGLIRRIRRKLCQMPFSTRNGSLKFCGSK